MALVGCGRAFFGAIPVEYESVELVCGSYGSLHERAGIHYTLSNASNQEITTFTLAFDLYVTTESGGLESYPNQGDNSFTVVVTSVLPTQAVRSLVTSLDAIVPDYDPSLVLRRFRVQQAHFADGSQWTNHGGHVWNE
ncbi:MAG: hypothetical protein ACLFP4_07140 [Spirochaetales bacterium]